MSFIHRFVQRARAILDRGRLAREMDEEMRLHLERAVERYAARGLSPSDARAAARREFGNLPLIEDEARGARGARWVDALAGDVRFAFRYFGRHKASTALIVAVLALGTGANALIFSMIQAQFFRPAPAMSKDDAHARFWARERSSSTASWQSREFTLSELQAIAEQRDVFEAVAAWHAHDVVLQGDDSVGARGVRAQFVTPNFFSVIGVSLAAGVGFVQSDLAANQTADLTVVISHEMADQLFGSATVAIGREVLVNEMPLRVVGVAPPRFQGALRDMDAPVLWIPLNARAEIARVSPRWLTEQATLSLVARLTAGASHEQATVRAQQVVANALPDSAARVGMARTAHVLPMHATPPGSDRNEMILAVTVVMTIGALILLVGWMNVSSLMVAAALARRHEIAVRLSLGASRLRLLRQLVTESTLLALTGGAIGMLLAGWLLVWFEKTEIDGIDVTPDAGTFGFVLAIAVFTGILFGLSPALHATRGAVANAIRDSGTGTSKRSRLQRGFVVAQIALSQPLLVLLGTMISVAMGEYQPLSPEMSRHVIRIGFRPLMRTGGPGQRAEAVDLLIPRIAERPEVVAVTPDPGGIAMRRVVVTDRPAPDAALEAAPTTVDLMGTAPGWFSIVDAPIILGRDVLLSDTAAVDYPIVIGTDFARALWGEVSPIGRTLASPAMSGSDQDSIALTVIGVYGATRRLPGMAELKPGEISTLVFTARGKRWARDRILVRTRSLAAPSVPELYRFIRAEAPALPVASMRTLEQVDEMEYREVLLISSLAGAGGIVALLLASLGLYGVVSLAVRQNMREIGIRIAVGATPRSVMRSYLYSGVRASLVALALGLPLSIVALKVGLSQGIVPAPDVDPWLIGIMIAPLLLAVAAAATWMPARRAALVDPAVTLRVE
jgi:putative ABC transport system permease protein